MSNRYKLGVFEPGSDEWLAARRGRLGGSEVAAVLGLSPFESRFSLWHRHAGNIGPVEETAEMEWGRRLEPVIIDKFADKNPGLRVGRKPGTFTRPDRAWQIANPDALIRGEDGEPTAVVEAKFSLFGDDFGEQGTDEVPVYYRTQALWYLDVLELEVCHFAVLVGGHDYREYVLRYDAAEAEQLRVAGRRFLDEVRDGTFPDIDEHGATYEAIKEMHPEIDGSEVELDPELAAAFVASRVAREEAKAEAQRYTSLVADAMGEAKKASCGGQTIATRQVREGGRPYVVIGRGLTKKEMAA